MLTCGYVVFSGRALLVHACRPALRAGLATVDLYLAVACSPLDSGQTDVMIDR